MKLDGILLDLYGTLTTGDRDAVEAVCGDVVRDAGLNISAYELSVTWGERFFHALDFSNADAFKTLYDLEIKTLVDTLDGLNAPLDPGPYVDRLLAYWQSPPIHADVEQFFAQCPLPVCIVSNADQADAEAALRRHGIVVDHLVTSEAVRAYKPDRTIFEHALKRTGWRRDRVIHVGDSLHSDIGGAIMAGLTSGWLNRVNRIHDVGTHQPDHTFHDLLELASWIAEQPDKTPA